MTNEASRRREETWYAASCQEPPLAAPPLEGRKTAGIGIIGGGLAGLALALGLAERGARPVVLEAGEVGAGASGRNGGLLSAGFTRDFPSLCRSLGTAPATRLFRLGMAALGLVERRIAKGAIACRPRYGVLEASWLDRPRELQAAIARENELFARDLRFWPREQLRQLYCSKRYFDGIFDPKARHLDPLALTRGHARLALAAGARLLERSPALEIARRNGGWRVTTEGGRLDVDRLVLATSAFDRGLHPALGRGLLPIHTYIIVSEPLIGAERNGIQGPYAVFDDRFATGYYRLVEGEREPGPRLLWGGGIGLAAAPTGLARRLLADLALVYPKLGRIRIAHAWSGPMGFARHRMPVIQKLEPGLWVVSGFGGHGLNTTTMAGEMLAEALLDEAADDWRLLAPFTLAWTGGPFAPVAARAFYHSRALQDRMQAAWHQLRRHLS